MSLFMLVIGNNAALIDEFKLEIMKEFEMTNQKKQDEVLSCQKKYAKEIIKKFKLEECNEMTTPMNSKEKLRKEDETEKRLIKRILEV